MLKRSSWSRLVLQPFEERVVPATVTWDGDANSLNWSDALNWSGDAVPASNDDVVIPDIGSDGIASVTITRNAGITIRSLTTEENVSMNGGGLFFTLAGGDLALNNGANLSLPGSNLDFNAGTGVTQQLTTNSTGTINLSGSSMRQMGASHTVSFNTGVTIRGNGTIGHITGGSVGGTWENSGTISSDVSGNTLTLAASNTFANHAGAVWEAETGSTLSISGTIENTGQTLTLPGPGTYNLTGTINGGTIELTNGAILQVSGGTLAGTTLSTATGGQVRLSTGTTLDGVTIATGADVAMPAISIVTVLGDLTLNGSILVQNGGLLRFSAAAGVTQNVTGAGSIVLATAASTMRVQQGGASHTVRFGSGVTLQAASGINLIGDLTTISLVPAFAGIWENFGTWTTTGGSLTQVSGTFVNRAGGTWGVDGGTFGTGGAWDNDGTLRVSSGTLNLDGAFTVANIGIWNRTGGIVNLTGTLNNTGSALTLDANTGGWNLAGGTITDGTVNATGSQHLTVTISNSVLDGVTVNGTVVVASAALLIRNNLTLANGSTFNLSGGAALTFNDSVASSNQQVIVSSGTATVNLATGNFRQSGIGHTVTFGSGLTVRGSGTVGQIFAGHVGGTYLNAGTFSADVAGGTVTLADGNQFQNQLGGVWQVAGGTFTIGAAVNWSGSGSIRVAGGTFNVSGAWTNTGDFDVSNGTLNLGGSFTTASVANFTRTGGTVNLTGTLNNTGVTLDLNDGTGSWTLTSGASIVGGTIATGGGAVLTLANGSTLNGVTIDTGATVATAAGATFAVLNGLTVNGTLQLGDAAGSGSGIMNMPQSQTLGGTGAIIFGGHGSNAITANVSGSATNFTLTLGSGLTIRGKTGTLGGSFTGGAVTNWITAATIRPDVSGGTITFGTNATTVVNSGTIGVSPGTTLTINAPNWSSTGLLDVNGGTLNLGGNFATASVSGSRFARSGGTVNLTGSLNNSGATLSLDSARGTWNLNDGTITGGSIQTDATNVLAVISTRIINTGNFPFASLNGVTVLSGSVIDLTTVSGAAVTIQNGLTLDGSILVGNAAGTNAGTLNFFGSQSVSGSGSVVFGGSTSNKVGAAFEGAVTNSTINLGSGIKIRGGAGLITGSSTGGSSATYNNAGTIQPDVAGGAITFNNAILQNTGTLGVGANQTLNISPTGGTSTGLVNVTGGTLNLGGNFSLLGSGISTTGGTVNLSGTVTNTGNTLFIGGGTWNVTGGTIVGGTIATDPGAVLNVNDRSTLNGVTIAGTVNLTTGGTSSGAGNNRSQKATKVLNGLTLQGGTINLIGGALNFPDLTQTLGGTGTINYSNSATEFSALWVSKSAQFGSTYIPGGSLTIASGITIQAAADNSTLGIGGYLQNGPLADVLPFDTTVNNFATIRANRLGSVVEVKSRGYNSGYPGGPDGGSVFTNRGLLEATSGGRVDIDYTFWHNPSTGLPTGQITMNGGTLDLRGTVPTGSLGSIVRTGGTVNLRGTITNTGTTLTLDSNRGTWNMLSGAIINGGRFATTGTGKLIVTSTGSPFASFSNNVTLDSPIEFGTASNTRLGAPQGLTLNNVTLTVPANAFINLGASASSTTLGGTGTILLNGGSVSQSASNSSLTIADGITIRGFGDVGVNTARLFNEGTIESTGGTLDVFLGRTNGVGGNSGTISALTGSTLVVYGTSTWVNSGTIAAASATLTINPFNATPSLDYREFAWRNTGTLSVTNSTFNLGGRLSQFELGSATPAATQGTFLRSGGTMNLVGTIIGGLTLDNATGTWRLASGILEGGAFAIAAGSTARLQAVANNIPYSLLRNGVTLNSPIDMDVVNNVRLHVQGGLTLNNITQTIGNTTGIGGVLTFGNSSTISGTGTIRINAGSLGQETDSAVLTIGPNIVVESRGGDIGWGLATLHNQGTIRSITSGQTVNLFFGKTNSGGASIGFGSNSGTVEALNGSTLNILGGSGWSNSGTINAVGSTLNIYNNSSYATFNWSSPGTISSTNSTVNFGGVTTNATFDNFTRTGGTVNLTGTISGGLTLTNAIGDVRFNGGTLNGGTFAVAPGSTARLIATSGRGLLRAVTLASPIDMVTNEGGIVDVANGLTLNTTMAMGDNSGAFGTYGQFQFNGSQTLRTDGGGEIVFGTRSNAGTIYQQSAGDVLTIGPGVTIRGTSGAIGNATGTLINQGTIRRDAGAGTFNISFGVNGRNEGLIDTTATSTAGGSLTIVTANSSNTWTNLGTISSAGVLSLGFQTTETWSNFGTISVTSGYVDLKGQFTQAGLGNFSRSAAATVRLYGTLSGNLHLDDTTGNWLVSGGTLQNGTLSTSGSARLIAVQGSSNTLRNYTIDGDYDLSSFQSTVLVFGPLTINTTLYAGNLAGSTSVNFAIQDDQTWRGAGTIVFGGFGNIFSSGTVKSLTIDSGLTLRGKKLTIQNGVNDLVLKGTILADEAGGIFDINSRGITNLGAIEARNSAEVLVHPFLATGLKNLAGQALAGSIYSGVLTGGSWRAGPSSALRMYVTTTTGVEFTALNADVTLDGLGSNFFGGAASTAFASQNALGKLTGVNADGGLTLTNGRTLNLPGAFNNTGNLGIGSASALTVSAPIDRWPGEGNANSASGQLNGVLTNGTTFAPGVTGQAFSFDGVDDSVAVTDNPALRPQRFTMDFWVYQDGAQTATAGLMMKADGSGTTWTSGYGLIRHSAIGGRVRFFINASGSAANILDTPNPLPANTWTRLTASFDGSTMRLYVDGALVNSRAFSAAITHTSAPLRFGNGEGGISPFQGRIDEPTLFDVAVSPAEIDSTLGYVQTSGTTTVREGGTFLSPGKTFNLQGGTLTGTGTINTSVVNSGGSVAPGNSPGFLDITGDYTQLANGELVVEIAGRDAEVPQFDRLRVTGTATLGGAVRVVRLDDFEPAPGDEFRVISAASRSGQFTSKQIPAPGGPAREIATVYDATGLTLRTQVVPPIEFVHATTSAPHSFMTADVVIDAAGNSYVAGTIDPNNDGTVDFDRERTYADNRDLFTTSQIGMHAVLVKYDSQGMVQWVRTIGRSGASVGSSAYVAPFGAIALDSRGNSNAADDLVYLAGDFGGTVEFTGGSPVLTSTAGTFVFQISAAGGYVDHVQFNGANTEPNEHVSVDGSGNVYVHFGYVGSIDADPGTGTAMLTNGGQNHAIVQLNSTLDFVRATRLSAATSLSFDGMDVSTDGKVWISGSIGSTTSGLAVLTPLSPSDSFVVRLDGSGTTFTAPVTQLYQTNLATFLGGTLIAVGPNGEVIVGGGFGFSVDFDIATNRAFTLTSAGDTDGYLLKLGANGEFIWARQVGGYREDLVNRVAFDGQGNVYAGGLFNNTVDFDPLDGMYLLEEHGSNPGSLFSPQGDGFVWKLDANGRFGWAAQFGDTDGGNVLMTGLAVNDAGRVSTYGLFEGTSVDFDPTTGTAFRSPAPDPGSLGLMTAFVTQLRQKAAPQASIDGLPSTALSEGATVVLAANVTDADSTFFTYQWTVTRDGVGFTSGTGPALAMRFPDQGTYSITLTATDETGNSNSASGTVIVNNAAPVLNSATFANEIVFASTAGASDNLPAAIATGGGFVLIGIPKRNIGAAADVGVVDVYTSGPTGGTLVRTLNAPAAVADSLFGSAVAVVGNFAVVGMPGPAASGGTVYVFSLASGTLVRTIQLADGAPGDKFGTALTSIGDFLVVGAPGRTSFGVANAGAAYLFDPATGALLQTYKNPSPNPGDEFGVALATVSGGLLIGAPGDDSGGADAGAAYFVDAGSSRVLQTIINPNGVFVGSRFGGVLSASGTTAAIGAPLDDSGGTDAGGVYLFDLDPSSEGFGDLKSIIRSPNASPNFGKFGSAVVLDGNRLLVGAETDGSTSTSFTGSGAAYLMDAATGSPTFGTSLKTFKKTTSAASDRFGAAVAFVGDHVLIGAPQDDTSVNPDGGRVYRFDATATVKLSAPTVTENGYLTLTGSFVDPGTSDSHTVLIDWGDGTAATTLSLAAGVSTFSAQHQYLDDSPSGTASDVKSVSVRVLDDTKDLLAVAANRIDRLDGSTVDELGAFVASGAGGLTTPSAVTVGPNGDIYVSSGAAGTNPVLRFSGATGALIGTFIAAGAQGTTKAADLRFGPDGHLYYADAAGNRVLKFNGRTGAFISSTTISDPRGLAFGPDGAVYVASFSSDAVVRSDGVAVTTFVTVADPVDLIFGDDGFLYVLSMTATEAVRRFDATTGQDLGTLANPPLNGATGYLLQGSVYVGDPTGGLFRYSTSTGELLSQAARATGPIAALSPMDESTSSITIANEAPKVAVVAAPNATAGQYTLQAKMTDAGTLDTHTFAWSITGGTAVGPTNGTSFTFTPTSGALTITLVITDDDIGSVTYKTQVVIGSAASETITLTNTNAAVGAANTAIPSGANTPNKVVVYGLNGNDTINASAVTSFPVELVGGSGSDTLTGGSLGDVLTGNNPGDYGTSAANATDDHSADNLSGGGGNDTLDGGLGDDTMAGGVGDDRYIEVPGSSDILTESGGSGMDTIDYSLAYSGITFSLADTNVVQSVDGTHTVTIQGQFENLAGSAYSDSLEGNELSNQISSGSGNDIIFGGDLLNPITLTLGDGNDTLSGGQGTDTVVGGSGNDIIFGGDLTAPPPGSTTPSPSPEPDPNQNSLIGGTGDDTVTGGSGNDIIFGGDPLTAPFPGPSPIPDNDSISGGAGSDTMTGGSGNDIIFGGDPLAAPGTPPPPGTTEDDSISGGTGNDTVTGGSGNDIIFGGDPLAAPGTPPPPGTTEDDSISGGTGNDTVTGGSGNDIIFGGDPLAAPGTAPPPGTTEDDSISGGTGNDTVTGGSGNDIIFGGDPLAAPGTPPPPGTTEDDSISGGTGNDTVTGGSGNDIIFGGDPLAAPTSDGTITDDDSLGGGQGSDTVTGGSGNDIIFGGDLLAPGAVPPPVTEDGNDSLAGGTGNDTVTGGSGNDIIFGGDPLASGATPTESTTADDDSLGGGAGSDTVTGGSGNDIIFGGELLTPGAVPPPGTIDGGDSLQGGTGNDTLTGGSGNDIIFGGEGDDALSGGTEADLFEGGSGSDRIVESADADIVLTATQIVIGASSERFYDIEQAMLTGGAGDNWISTTGLNRFGQPVVASATAFIGPVIFSGGSGNDTLVGGEFGDQLIGGSGNDSLIGGAGADSIDLGSGADFADGGADNDAYVAPADTAAGETIADADGIDSIDLSGGLFAANIDLTLVSQQITDRGGNRLTLIGAFENVRGTSFDDVIKGTDDRNIIEGFGGRDLLDGGAAADTVQGGFPQIVYLDFDTATGRGEKVYTVEERNLIQAKLESIFRSPFNVTFTQTAPSIARYTSIVINAGAFGSSEVLVGGAAYELDWRNYNSASRADINVNAFLGRTGQPAASSDNYVALTTNVIAHELGHLVGLKHSDAFGPIGINPTSGLPYGTTEGLLAVRRSIDEIAIGVNQFSSAQYGLKNGPVLLAPVLLTGNVAPSPVTPPAGVVFEGSNQVATFTVNSVGVVAVSPNSRVMGGTLNAETGVLTLQWTTPPVSSSIRATYQYDAFRPGYRGPDDAFESAHHLMASPASIGSTLTDAVGVTSLGERELIKLAFAEGGASRHEGNLTPTTLPAAMAGILSTGQQARNLGTLRPLAVPNLLPAGSVNQNNTLAVRAAGVVGSINLTTATPLRSENDVYAFQSAGNEYLSVEVLSVSIRQRLSNPIDSIVRIYGPNGQLLDFYGQPAINDDGIDNQDSLLQDVKLQLPGTYYIVVDTFVGATDFDTGGYELFVYTYSPLSPSTMIGGGDSMIGGAGADVLIGGSGKDQYVGSRGEDTFVGATTDDLETGTLITAPTATVTLSPANPQRTGVLVATATGSDLDGQLVTFTFLWTVNGIVVSGATTNSLNLGTLNSGNGALPGDVVTVYATPYDVQQAGDEVSATIVVENSAPIPLVQALISTPEDRAIGILASVSDPNGDALTLTLTQMPQHGTLTVDSSSLLFVYTPAANYVGPDSFRYLASDGISTTSEQTVSIDVTAVNDAPTISAPTTPIALVEDVAAPISGVNVADIDSENLVVTISATNGTLSVPLNVHGGLVSAVVGDTTSNLTLTGSTAEINATLGILVYSPNADYAGTAAINVTVNDQGAIDAGGPRTANATINLAIAGTNDTPTALPQAIITNEDTAYIGRLSASDPDGQYIGYSLVGSPSGVTFEPTNGVFTYTPAANFNGNFSFQFSASDGTSTSNVATVTIAVIAANDPPVFNSINDATINEDASLQTVTISGVGAGGGADEASQSVAFSAVSSNPAIIPHPVITGTGSSRTLTYQPVANAYGTVTITVTASDGQNANSTFERTFTITVKPVNDAPSFTNGPDQTVLQGSGPQSISNWAANLSAGPPNENDQTLSFLVTTNDNALFSVLPQISATGALTFTPSASANGVATVTVQIKDSGGTLDGGVDTSVAQTFKITVLAANTAPVANDDNYTTNEDTILSGNVLANDVDAENNPLQAVLVAGPTHAAAFTLSADGSFSYTPTANYNGADSFTYRATDGSLQSSLATVTINITSVNDAPIISGVPSTATIPEGTAYTFTATVTDVDSPANDLVFSLVDAPSGATIESATGVFNWTPSEAQGPGSYVFKVRVSDGTTPSDAPIVLVVSESNSPPVANADNATVNEGGTVAVLDGSATSVLDNDTDPDLPAATLTATLVNGPTHAATFTLNSNGTFTYTHNGTETTTDSFTYQVSDGLAVSNVVSVTISIAPVNDAPVAIDDAATTNEDTPLTLTQANLKDNDSDDDHLDSQLSVTAVGNATNGTVLLNGDGTITFTPTSNFHGTAGFDYTLSDGTLTDVGHVTVTVSPVNDAPVANDDIATVSEDSGANAINVLGNDSIAPDSGETLTVTAVTPGAHGSVTFSSTGVTYTPNANYTGSDNFTYTISDGNGGTATATVNVTVTAINDAPVLNGVPVSATIPEGSAYTFIATATDVDLPANTLTFSLVGQPLGASINSTTGEFTWTPSEDQGPGDYPFTVRVSDGTTATDAAITLTVSEVNTAPVLAAIGNQTATEQSTLTFTASATDPDLPTNTLSYSLDAASLALGMTINATTGAFSWTPTELQGGTTYPVTITVTDNGNPSLSDAETFAIDVSESNSPPVANPDSATVNEGGTVAVLDGSAASVLDNDTDADLPATTLTATLVSGPTHAATFTLNANGTFTYTHNGTETTTDSFTYQVSDGLAVSNVVSVTISIAPVNDAPVAIDDAATTNEDTPLSLTQANLNGNDTDADHLNSQLIVTAVGNATNGTVLLNGDGTITFTPTSNFHGTAGFDYTLSDGTLTDVGHVTVTVSPVNDAPVALADSASVNEDGAVDIDVRSNDSAGPANESDQLFSVTAVTQASNGAVSINADGTVRYVPAANFSGTDSFTYTITDNGVTNGASDPKSATATVSVTVNSANDAPVATNDSYSVNEDTQLNVPAQGVLGNDTDVDSSTLTAVLVSGPQYGNLTLNPDGSFTYLPQSNFHGSDSFTYRTSDGTAQSSTATVAIAVAAVNDAPTAGGDNYGTAEDTPLTVTAPGVLANDADVDGNSLSAVVVTGPQHGSLTLNADGSFTYTPASNFHGVDSFTYRASDSAAQSNLATVTITVAAVNDAPNAIDDTVTTTSETAVTIDVLTNDLDVDGDALTVTAVGTPAHGSAVVNANGTITYTPIAGFAGTDSFTYTISDSHGGTSTATVFMTIDSTGSGASIQVDPIDPSKTALVVRGTSGDDDIELSPGADGGVSVTMNGTALGTFNPTGRILVLGLDGNDEMQTAGSIDRSVWLFGGSGNDRLKGGGSHDVLVGGVGDDLLVGGNGRDLLVGGFGSDRIVGNADEDILIAGSSDFDESYVALSAIMDEWTRNGATFSERVTNLRDVGVGAGNSFKINDQTVHDDGVADVLTGSSGVDWFIFNFDGVGDAKDRATDMSTFEAENPEDIEFINGP